ncbi:helix-turn-helix domain-containing protein [Bilophila wadsworthia]|jgi:transcriptional regulator with XRE-family HTH domain
MSKKSSPCPFGKILVTAREERGITQYRLARLAGRSIQQISQIERG